MTTIEKLLATIEALKEIATEAIALADEYSGGDSETATELKVILEQVMSDHNKDN
jgi:hypothetical protein